MVLDSWPVLSRLAGSPYLPDCELILFPDLSAGKADWTVCTLSTHVIERLVLGFRPLDCKAVSKFQTPMIARSLSPDST
jgi:hypothetical protein